MKESTKHQIAKEIKMDSGEELRISIELINVKEKSYSISKDFLETMFKEIKLLF